MNNMRTLAIAALVCVVSAIPSYAQADRARGWLAELSIVETAAAAGSTASRQTRVSAVRKQVDDWLALNPRAAVDLPKSPDGAWTEDQLREQLALLRKAIERLVRSDPSQPFYLGITAVNVTAPGAALSPVSDHMDRVEIRNHDARTVNQAIEYLPGVSVDHKAPRNQTGISIGGFDGRQVPLYLDGIPAYQPFDGYVDLTRYLTSDLARIQVAKGYSSPLLGPNVMGGVVNLVTRQPEKTFEGEAFIGTAPGALLNTGIHVGSQWPQFFAQASGDRLQSDFYPISGSFASNAPQPGSHRVNSYQRDERYRARVGWTPKAPDSYVLSYTNQQGETGVPPYSGAAPVCPTGGATLTIPCVTPKYWQWPQWNTDGLYFNSRTGLGLGSSLQVRAFYVRYANTMAMFDDATYSTMNVNASSGTLDNRDHSVGVSGEFETRRVRRHAIGASFFVKGDTHAEQSTTVSRANVVTTTPTQTNRDRQSSFGLQDIITVSSRITATVGISADHLNGLQAQDLSSDRTQVVPFQVAGTCSAGASSLFTSCTTHEWAYNPVGSISYSAGDGGTLFAAFAHKSRFPTLKDRYSYRAGRAAPNPLLRPEHASTWTAGYSRVFPLRTVAQIDVFHSDVRDKIENIFFLSPLCSGGGRGAPGSCQQAANVGAEKHGGVNVTVRSTPVPRLTVDANYTYLHRDISGAAGAFPVGTPTHKAVTTGTLRLPRDATGLVSARYQSGAVGMSDNGLPLPPATFTTIDLGATLPLRAGVSVQGGVKNLFDRNYYYWEGFPEAGRTGYVTVRYAF
jgi:iron complex outermembrane receptor protein